MYLRWQMAVLIGVSFFTAACGSNSSGYCPGLCPTESTMPTMTFQVDGGVPAIASAKVVSGPCTQLLLHSAGEAGAPASYAATQVTYNGPADVPPLCLIELTSIDGETLLVQASVLATDYQQPCCPIGSCCQSSVAIALHHRVVFDRAVQTISFPSSPNRSLDAGLVDAEENTSEAGHFDRAEDIPVNVMQDAAIDEATEPALDADQVLDQVLDLASAS